MKGYGSGKKGYSNVVKGKSKNTSSVSDSYSGKYGGGKFDADSTQGTGYHKGSGPMKGS